MGAAVNPARAAQKDVNHLIEQLALGNDNPEIGNRRVKGLKNVSEARGRNEEVREYNMLSAAG